MMKTYTVIDIFTSELFCTQTVCVVMKQHQTTHIGSHIHTIVIGMTMAVTKQIVTLILVQYLAGLRTLPHHNL